MATMATRRQVIAVASLTRDSPSRMVTSCRGRPDPAGDGGGRHRIRRGHHGAERERHGEVDRQHPPGDQARRPSAVTTTSTTDSEHDGALVGPEVDHRGPDRGGVEQRRQEAEQHQFGGQLRRGHERHERMPRCPPASAAAERRSPAGRPPRSPPARRRRSPGWSARCPRPPCFHPGEGTRSALSGDPRARIRRDGPKRPERVADADGSALLTSADGAATAGGRGGARRRPAGQLAAAARRRPPGPVDHRDVRRRASTGRPAAGRSCSAPVPGSAAAAATTTGRRCSATATARSRSGSTRTTRTCRGCVGPPRPARSAAMLAEHQRRWTASRLRSRSRWR